jgi:hypothetical protein
VRWRGSGCFCFCFRRLQLIVHSIQFRSISILNQSSTNPQFQLNRSPCLLLYHPPGSPSPSPTHAAPLSSSFPPSPPPSSSSTMPCLCPRPCPVLPMSGLCRFSSISASCAGEVAGELSVVPDLQKENTASSFTLGFDHAQDTPPTICQFDLSARCLCCCRGIYFLHPCLPCLHSQPPIHISRARHYGAYTSTLPVLYKYTGVSFEWSAFRVHHNSAAKRNRKDKKD